MSHGTTIGLVKGAVVDGIAALDLMQADNPAVKVQVEWGDPGKNIERESIFVEGTEPRDEQEWSAIGDRQREEKYSLILSIVVHAPGKEAREVELRALDLLAEVEAFFRGNPQVGLDVSALAEMGVQSLIVDFASGDLQPFFTDQGRGALIQGAVRATARI